MQQPPRLSTGSIPGRLWLLVPRVPPGAAWYWGHRGMGSRGTLLFPLLRHTHVLAVVQHDGAAVTPRGDVVSHGAPGRVHQRCLVPRRVLLPLQHHPHRLRAGLGTQRGQPRPAATHSHLRVPTQTLLTRGGGQDILHHGVPKPPLHQGSSAGFPPGHHSLTAWARCLPSWLSVGARWDVPAQQNASLGLYLQTMLSSSSNFRQSHRRAERGSSCSARCLQHSLG